MDFPLLSLGRTAELSKLKMKKFRHETGLMIVDGSRVIGQLLSDGILPLQLYVLEGHSLPPGFEDVHVFRASENAMRRICDSENPQAIAGLYSLPKQRNVEYSRAFYLDGISDPGNMGTIFRIARAFGFDTILLSEDCAEPASPKVARASLGAVFSVPYRELLQSGFKLDDGKVIATSADAGLSLWNLRLVLDEPVVVVIGSEAHGIRPEIAAMANISIRIAMLPAMESLNAAVAAGIIAHHIYHLGYGTDSV